MITYNVAGNSHGVDEVSLNLVQHVLEVRKRMDVRFQWGSILEKKRGNVPCLRL